jgi:ketosteroid isomerase-like protein
MGLILPDKELIRKLYIDLCHASINKDLDKLNEILSDDYILVHMTGMKQTKEDYIESVKSGELAYYKSRHESIEVNINGEEATIIGKTKTLASPFGSSKSWWNLRQDLKAKKIDGKWMLIYSKASSY